MEEINLNSVSQSQPTILSQETFGKENSLSQFIANTQDLNQAITVKTFENALFHYQSTHDQPIIPSCIPSSSQCNQINHPLGEDFVRISCDGPPLPGGGDPPDPCHGSEDGHMVDSHPGEAGIGM